MLPQGHGLGPRKGVGRHRAPAQRPPASARRAPVTEACMLKTERRRRRCRARASIAHVRGIGKSRRRPVHRDAAGPSARGAWHRSASPRCHRRAERALAVVPARPVAASSGDERRERACADALPRGSASCPRTDGPAVCRCSCGCLSPRRPGRAPPSTRSSEPSSAGGRGVRGAIASVEANGPQPEQASSATPCAAHSLNEQCAGRRRGRGRGFLGVHHRVYVRRPRQRSPAPVASTRSCR